MNTKVYLKTYCEKAKKEVPFSYEVIYFDKVPKIGNIKCEYHTKVTCAHCALKNLSDQIVSEHFEKVYKKEFDKNTL